MSEPASLTAMRQLVAEARLRRTGSARVPGRSGALRPPVEEAADRRQDDSEDELTDAHDRSVAGEPGHRRDEQDHGDPEDEQADQPLTPGVTGAGGCGV
jgi:hypothetical protein